MGNTETIPDRPKNRGLWSADQPSPAKTRKVTLQGLDLVKSCAVYTRASTVLFVSLSKPRVIRSVLSAQFAESVEHSDCLFLPIKTTKPTLSHRHHSTTTR